MARSFRQWASAIVRAALPVRSPSPSPMDLFPSARGDAPVGGASDVLASYAHLPWLRAVTGRIAQALAATDWQLYAVRKPQQRAVKNAFLQRASGTVRRKALNEMVAQKNADQILEHPLLDLLHNGNPHHTGVQLWRLTSASLDLVGEVYWLLQRNGVGVPAALWPIPPTWVLETPVPGRDTYRVNFKGRYAAIPSSEVLALADPNPADPYGRGTGLASALGDELATDEYAAKLVRQFFLEGARPDFLIWPKNTEMGLDPAELKRFTNDWLNRHQGYQRAWRPYMSQQEMGVHEFDKDFGKMQMVELRQFERDTIIQTYGMPPEMLGVLTSSNRATIEAAEYIFTRWVLTPRLELLRSILQERLVPEFDDRLVIDYVSPVPEDTARELDAAKAQPHVLTVNEWRALAGQPPVKDGEVYMMPPQLVPVTSLDEGPAPMLEEPPAPPLSAPARPEGLPTTEGEIVAPAGAQTPPESQ
jgi:HK97 family phage portal protein